MLLSPAYLGEICFLSEELIGPRLLELESSLLVGQGPVDGRVDVELLL